MSYNNEFLDQYEYFFDADEKLVRIKRSNEAGIDETSIAYSYYRGETTKTYFMNEVIQKSIRNSKKRKGKSTYKIRLTKEYLKGEPNIANEQWYSTDDVLLSEEQFRYDTNEKSFVSDKTLQYTYDKGLVSEITTTTTEAQETKKYIYQFDKEEGGNWVKQIIIPENSYVTRKITYYEEEVKIEE